MASDSSSTPRTKPSPAPPEAMTHSAAVALWQVSIRTRPQAEEAVGELLYTVTGGAVSSYLDVRTQAVLISVHLPRLPVPRPQLLAALRLGLRHIRQCGLETGSALIRFQRLPPSDWAEVWKKHFPPFEIGRHLLVRPSWSRRKPRPGQSVLEIDPGLSFGTGHHPTTRFCLEQLANCRDPGQSQALLDIGTGSGLLALAAARLGYQPVKAFDHDAQAVRTARENADRNRLTRQLTLSRADLRSFASRRKGLYDVVCANLTADLLVSESRRIATQVRPGGVLLLAGILRRELASVRDTYIRIGLRAQLSRREGEWASIRLDRKCF